MEILSTRYPVNRLRHLNQNLHNTLTVLDSQTVNVFKVVGSTVRVVRAKYVNVLMAEAYISTVRRRD